VAEHHDPDVRARLAQALRGLDAFVMPARRHADIGKNDVGILGFDSHEERVEVPASGYYFELGLALEQSPDALAHEVAVLGEDEADRHAASIRGWLPTAEQAPVYAWRIPGFTPEQRTYAGGRSATALEWEQPHD
jgi:hypothetical protein